MFGFLSKTPTPSMNFRMTRLGTVLMHELLDLGLKFHQEFKIIMQDCLPHDIVDLHILKYFKAPNPPKGNIGPHLWGAAPPPPSTRGERGGLAKAEERSEAVGRGEVLLRQKKDRKRWGEGRSC